MRWAALLWLGGCGAPVAPPERRVETVAIPGTSVRFEMARVAPGAGKAPFWMATREVTWREFDRFYEFPQERKVDGVTRPSAGKNYLQLSGLSPEFMAPDRPVTNLRYHSALAYCEWLSWKTGAVYRLPTEPEWEAAGRGTPGGHAWTAENSGERTHRGGEKEPNAFGIHDLRGNVWEYALESADPPGFEPVLLGGAWNATATEARGMIRKSAPAEWSEADPNRPFSVWWFRADHSQGFRVVRVAEASSRPEREAHAARIEVAGLEGKERAIRVGGSTALFMRVTGLARNGGDRPLAELALKIYFLDPAGKPHLEDVSSNQTRRATWNVCFPALATSAHPGEHARPLGPGEARAFTVDLPMTLDGEDQVRAGRFGASVLHLRFDRD